MLNIHFYPQNAEKTLRNIILVYSMMVSFIVLELALIFYVIMLGIRQVLVRRHDGTSYP